MKPRIGRRDFINYAGRAGILVPMINYLNLANASQSVPKRAIFIVSMLGQPRTRFFPADPITQIDSDCFGTDLSSIAGPMSEILDNRFDQYRSKMTIVRGLGSQDSGGHDYHLPLTGSNAAVLGDYGLLTAPLFPYSIDHVLGEFLYSSEPMARVLRSAPDTFQKNTYSYSWAYKDNLTYKPSYANFGSELFANAFKVGVNGFAPQQLAAIQAATQTNYQPLIDSLKTSTYDKARLDGFLDNLGASVTRLCSATLPAECQVTSDTGFTSTAIDIDQAYQEHFNIITSALTCGATQVVVISIPHYKNGDVTSEYHGASHNLGTVAGDVAWLPYQQWITNKILALLAKLDAVNEPNGKTLLDNSIVFWTNNCGNGGTHDMGDMPLVLFGGGNGTLKMGRFLDYRVRPLSYLGASNYVGFRYNDILVTILKAMGLTPQDYQRDGKVGFGEYSCSRMFEVHANFYLSAYSSRDRNQGLAGLLT